MLALAVSTNVCINLDEIIEQHLGLILDLTANLGYGLATSSRAFRRIITPAEKALLLAESGKGDRCSDKALIFLVVYHSYNRLYLCLTRTPSNLSARRVIVEIRHTGG